ncbi:Zn-ribbon domain-containing OB-fold protein [Sphingomonas sp. 1P08PE]|uniref:Zn-ribbon domain-containing OB-fold protein n=1 Tax=Sphingomonas sp. 1P08PE TaxID=554122 RepID=UPI0039A26BEF
MGDTFKHASPVRDADNAPFFDAALEGRLLIKKCDVCEEAFFQPRDLCPFCLSESSWIEASGSGSIYSYTAVTARDGNYVLALVTLTEGPTIMTNIVTDNPGVIAVDMPVKVQFVDTAGDEKMFVFAPS